MPLDLTGMEKRCGRGDTLSRGEFTLENNTWGADGVSSFAQCICATPAGDQLAWTWDFPAEAVDRVKAYPEVIFGKKPFSAGPSTTVKLPRPLTPVPSLRVEFASRTDAQGRYNAAFEIWLTNSPSATQASITHEVMFWVGHAGDPQPAGDFVRTVALENGRTCDLWAGPMQSWTYFAFVFREPVTSGIIEFGYYLRNLLEDAEIPANAYIADLEFGNEVWYGSGSTVLDLYGMTVADDLK